MCDPATMTALYIGTSLIQGNEQRKVAEHNSEIAKQNALVQQKLAASTIKRGDQAEAKKRTEVARFKSEQEARMLAGGGQLVGSNARILQDTSELGELDALTVRSNFEREAYGHKVSAQNYQYQADQADYQAASAVPLSLLGGAAQAGSAWYQSTL